MSVVVAADELSPTATTQGLNLPTHGYKVGGSGSHNDNGHLFKLPIRAMASSATPTCRLKNKLILSIV